MPDGFDDDPTLLATLDLTTAGIAEMLPGVLPPLVWDVSSHMIEEAFRHTFDALGALGGDLVDRRGLLRRVEGRAALDLGRLGAVAAALPGGQPDDIEDQYFGSRRAGRPASAASPRRHSRLRSARHDVRVLAAHRRACLDADIVVAATDHVLADRPALDGLDDRALLAHHLRVLDLATRAAAAELTVAADAAASYRRLEVVLTGPVGEAEAGRIAERCTTPSSEVAATDRSASAAVVGGPTWEELDRAVPERRPARETASAEAVLDEALAAAPGWSSGAPTAWLRRRAMRHLAADATEQLARRERTKTAVLRLGGELRRCHLELGRRLVAVGALDAATDVDLLSLAELRRLPLGAGAPGPAALAERRSAQLEAAAAGPLPARFTGVPQRAAPPATPHDHLEGWAVSPGTYRGTAVALRSADEPLPAGAVLVAESTDPSWVPAFTSAGAVVLERGGPLSHAAILARELGIPAVLNVPDAIALLDGRTVEVDGSAGVVRIVSGAEEPAP